MWTVGVSAGGKPNPACSESYDRCWVLGPALVPGSARGFWGWNDWVINWRGSPKASLGHLEIWRNGKLVLPKQTLSTAYDDPKAPYLKFGVCTTTLSPPRHHARVCVQARVYVQSPSLKIVLLHAVLSVTLACRELRRCTTASGKAR